MRLAIADTIRGEPIARRGTHRHVQLRCILERLPHRGDGLLRPLAFGRTPADRQHRRRIRLIMHRQRDRVDEALIGVSREIDCDRGTWRYPARHMDVERDFAVGAAGIARIIARAIDANRDDRRHGAPHCLERRLVSASV